MSFVCLGCISLSACRKMKHTRIYIMQISYEQIHTSDYIGCDSHIQPDIPWIIHFGSIFTWTICPKCDLSLIRTATDENARMRVQIAANRIQVYSYRMPITSSVIMSAVWFHTLIASSEEHCCNGITEISVVDTFYCLYRRNCLKLQFILAILSARASILTCVRCTSTQYV